MHGASVRSAAALCAAARSLPVRVARAMSQAVPAPASAPAPPPPPARRVRVYTRTGDQGSSSLYNGERRPKDDAYFAALGDVDELNACLGLARTHCAVAGVPLDAQLVEVQSRLLDVGSAIATPAGTSTPAQLARAAFPEHCTSDVERWIDAMDEELPPLRNFILPGGNLAAAHLHVARTVARRAERRVVALGADGAPHAVAVYLNRLSDYLFVAARFAAQRGGATEAVYAKARGLTERPLGGGGAATEVRSSG